MRIVTLVVGLLLGISTVVRAQDIREERVQFQPGTSGAFIEDIIRGYEIADYLLKAQVGQEMTVNMETSNPSAYFNVMIGDNPEAIHVGSINGNEWSGILPKTADYRIRIYMMRAAARRDELANYLLKVGIGAIDPDFADGLSGGSDYWEVANVPANDVLNVRSGPGTSNPIVGELANGDMARNLGCESVGSSRWCQIEAGVEMRFTGWVNSRYLREANSPTGNHEAAGQIPCSMAVGQPTGRCDFRVTRGISGNAAIWVDIGNDLERFIEFRNGAPITSEAGLEVAYEKVGDLFLIRMGDIERYEVPEAVVFGG